MILRTALLISAAFGAPVAAAPRTPALQASTVYLEQLDLSNMTQEWGEPHRSRSVEGNPLRLHGRTFEHGVGTHARSEMLIDLKGGAQRFTATVGVDDEKTGAGSVDFQVWLDGKLASDSGVQRGGQEPKAVDVDLRGARKLTLIVTDGGDGIDSDHADWADAVITYTGARPQAVGSPVEPPMPIHHTDNSVVGIHGPRITGATPGRPFLFLIPATGEPPLSFSARGLPPGLALDSRTGIISGSLREPGQWVARVTVRAANGSASRRLTIVGGTHKLALTPPLGWNSWNVWAGAVDADKVRAAADWMVKSGLAAHGFQYVNIDDTWEGQRDPNGEITTNRKFPDMKGLADYVHSQGLKLGIYSSPGPRTCAGFPASYQHEQQDADIWARWGIDYLKHDWCSYGGIAKGSSLEELQKPYIVMRGALDHCSRDIVYSLCQYGMGEVWKWGAEIGANCWRTTGDITDTWGSMAGNAFREDGRYQYGGPGHWNDPDMLVVGKLGWGPQIHPTRLTPNEQITHISFWCMTACPLLLGCDLAQMDAFTTDLMTNDEVLDVDQDPLGKPAERRAKEGMLEVWSRPLWDGTTAVALFNRGPAATQMTARWADLGLHGRQPVRDLWQQKPLGTFQDVFSATVPAHGTVLVKIGRVGRAD